MQTVFRMISVLVSALLAILGIGTGSGTPGDGVLDPNAAQTLTVGAGSVTGQMTHKAAGFLYGFAEPDVPSENTLSAIGVYTAVAKPKAGLQHPMGDITQVYETFFAAGGEYLQVYCQDKIDTWYYQPPAGGLSAYYEMLKDVVTDINNAVAPEYRSRIVYYPFNEPDGGGVNTGWFSKGNFSAEYNEAFLTSYQIIKSVNPEAKVGGPNFQGYTDNNADQMETFMTFCRDNGCLPDVVSWHELAEIDRGPNSFTGHYAQYRALEQALGISPIEVCITEYGAKTSNSMPSNSMQWISVFEAADAAGCRAYWRTANNMNDLTGDYNSPNADWWVYKWYNEMLGDELALTSSNGNVLRGVAAFDEADGALDVIYAGADSEGAETRVTVQNLGAAFPGQAQVHMRVESVDFVGLTGECLEPVVLFDGDVPVTDGSVTWQDGVTTSGAYKITLTKATGGAAYENPVAPIQVEVSSGENLIPMPTSKAVGDDRWNSNYTSYAKSGGSYCTSGARIGGHPTAGVLDTDATFDSVKVTYNVTIPVSGVYKCDFVYSNQLKAANGDRAPAEMTIRWNGADDYTTLRLENTYTVAYMDMATTYKYLPAGAYTIETTVASCDGKKLELYDVGLDFMRLTAVDTAAQTVEDYLAREIALTAERTVTKEGFRKFMLVTETGGYYRLTTDAAGEAAVYLDGTHVGDMDLQGSATVYLRKGVNYIAFDTATPPAHITLQKDLARAAQGVPANAGTVTLSGTASLVENPLSPTGFHVGNLARGAVGENSATFGFNVPRSGWYRITLAYANDQCFGSHDYNPQQIDRYARIRLNGEDRGVAYFRNTQSWNYFSEKTLTLYCTSGYNELELSNDGSYVWWGEGDSVTISSGATMTLSDIYAPDFAGISVAAAFEA